MEPETLQSSEVRAPGARRAAVALAGGGPGLASR